MRGVLKTEWPEMGEITRMKLSYCTKGCATLCTFPRDSLHATQLVSIDSKKQQQQQQQILLCFVTLFYGSGKQNLPSVPLCESSLASQAQPTPA